ncbi:MAG: T9SS type A sorting domain-containing protein [Flavipsychrobacter sp.]
MKHLIATLCYLALIAQLSQAQTHVSGQIRTNTTWTKTNSPYIVDSKVEVANNTSLTVDPGVTIIMKATNIVIYGNLTVNATTQDPVRVIADPKELSSIDFNEQAFSKTNKDTLQLQNMLFENVGINFFKNGPSLMFSNNKIKGTTNVTWEAGLGESFIFNNNHVDAEFMIYMTGNTPIEPIEQIVIKNNKFENSIKHMAVLFLNCTSNKGIIIEENEFLNNGTAIRARGNKTTTITKNNFIGNHLCIDDKGQSASINVNHNIFMSNLKAIRVYSNDFDIQHNSIYYNRQGISLLENNTPTTYTPPNIIIENNCIYENIEYSIRWGNTNNWSLGNNWWGTTDTNKIDSAIIDFTEDFKLGKVSYGIMAKKDGSCKTITLPPTSIQEIKKNKDVSIYPNPYSNIVTFDFGTTSVLSISLYDITGRELVSKTNPNTNVKFDTENQPSGVYIYKITFSDKTTQTGRLIKQ